MTRFRAEIVAWMKVLESSVLYATIIVTFGIQGARVDGQSMAPILKDQDRLVVNKLAYHIGEPEPGVNDQIIPAPYVAGDHHRESSVAMVAAL